MKKKMYISIIVLITLATVSQADTLIWTHATGTKWETASNWYTNTVPVSGVDSVVLNGDIGGANKGEAFLISVFTLASGQTMTSAADPGDAEDLKLSNNAVLTFATGSELNIGMLSRANKNSQNMRCTFEAGVTASLTQYKAGEDTTTEFVANAAGVTTVVAAAVVLDYGDGESTELVPDALEVDLANYDIANGTTLVLFDYESLTGTFATVTLTGGFTGTIDYAYDQGGGDLGIALTNLTVVSKEAYGPDPVDSEINVDPAVVLEWNAGITALSHEVFFARAGDTLVSQGIQTGTTFDPVDPITSYDALEVEQEYIWCVDEFEGAGGGGTKYTGNVWSFTTAVPYATVPVPADSAIGVDPAVVLAWNAGVTTLSHEVFFARAGDALVSQGIQDANSFDPVDPITSHDALEMEQEYIWRVDEFDGAGGSGTKYTGDVWSFTTAVPYATVPVPADSEIDIDPAVVLEWTASPGTVSHNVYFGTTNPPAYADNVTSSSYDPLGATDLDSEQFYYWQIGEVDAYSNEALSEVWSFTTVDNSIAWAPSPADGATGVALDAACTNLAAPLSWEAGVGAVSRDVYFGEAADALELVSYDQSGTTYLPDFTLFSGTTYHWRVDEYDGTSVYEGDVWSFSTVAAVNTNWDDGEAADHLWSSPLNWNPDVLPGNGSSLSIYPTTPYGPVIDATVTASSGILRWRGGNMTISGGSYTLDGAFIMGEDAGTESVLTMSDGVLSPVDFWCGHNGDGVVNMSGGTLNVSNTFYFPRKLSSTGNGDFNFSGGTINVATSNFLMVSSLASGDPNMNITGDATLVIAGDVASIVQDFVDDGWVTCNSSTSPVRVVYDGTNTIVTAPSPTAWNPYPANTSINVIADVNLSWSAGEGAISHDVYFGTSSNPPFIQTQSETTYNPTGTLAAGTTYYWRIDEYDGTDTYQGDVWSFTTQVEGFVEPVFDCNTFRLKFNSNTGYVSSIYKKNDSEELMTDADDNSGFWVTTIDDAYVHLVYVSKNQDDQLVASSSDGSYIVTFDVNASPNSNYMTFSIADLVGFPTEENTKLSFEIRPDSSRDWLIGSSIACWRGEGDAFGMMPLDYMVILNGNEMTLDWHYLWNRDDDPNNLGDFAIFVCDEDDALDNIEIISKEQDSVPYPLYYGEWGKKANDLARQCMIKIAGITGSVGKQKAIDYTAASGLGILQLMEGDWEGTSVCTYDATNFPGGVSDFLAFSRALRDKGALLGLHTGSCRLEKNDSVYLSPTPSSGLASWGSGTLVSDINSIDTTILFTPDAGVVAPSSGVNIGERPPVYPTYCDYKEVHIGNELINVGIIDSSSSPWTLMGCTRGVDGTTAASHSSGSTVKGLVTIFGAPTVDTTSNMYQEIVDKFVSVVNDGEVAFVAYDSVIAANGTGLWGREKFIKDTYDDFDHFVGSESSSGPAPYQWYMKTTNNNGEPMHTVSNAYFEGYLLSQYDANNFIPEGLGNFTFRTENRAGGYYASMPDDFEWVSSKCVAYDAVYIFRTEIEELDYHGQTDEIFALISKWDRARLNEVFTEAQKSEMKDLEMSFRLTDSDIDSSQWEITPTKIMPSFVQLDGSTNVNNIHAAQGMKFDLQVLPSFDYSSVSNIGLLPLSVNGMNIASGLDVSKVDDEWTFSMTNSGDLDSDAKMADTLHSEIDMSCKRGVGLYFTGDGNGGYFVVECKGGKYRQYIVPNDSSIRKYVEIPSTEVSDYLYIDDLYYLYRDPWASTRMSPDLTNVINLGFGLMGVPANTSVSVTVEGIKALAETETTLSDLTMTVDGTTLTVDGSVASGNYLVYEGGSTADVLDPDRNYIETLSVNSTGWQKDADESSVSISCTGTTKPWVKILFKTLGTPFNIPNPMDADLDDTTFGILAGE